MLDIKVYPACLDCPCPKMESSGSTTAFMGCDIVENQYIECDHHVVCKRIDGQERIELRGDIGKYESGES